MKNLTGIGFYLANTLAYLAQTDAENEYYLYSNKPLEHHVENAPNFHERIVKGNLLTQRLGSLWMRFSLAEHIRQDKIDVFWGPEFMLPQRVAGIKYVVTIHDLALLLNPKWGKRSNAIIQRVFTPWAIRQADEIIAVSEATKRDVVRLCHIHPDKIHVTHLGGHKAKPVAPEREKIDQTLAKYGVGRKYFLYLGTLEPRKNVDGIVRAFDVIAEDNPDIELVIAGGLGWRYRGILDGIDAAKHKQRIKRLGYVGKEEKEPLYAGALAFVFPSHYEGFGIPIVEALEMRTLVITARNSSLPEVAGDVGLYVEDETCLEDMVQAMKRIVSMDAAEREQTIARGDAFVKNFSWEKCARETSRILRG